LRRSQPPKGKPGVYESGSGVRPGLGGPEQVEFFLDAGEVFVAGGEGGFALEGEGGGENGKTRRQKVEWGWLGSIDAL